MAIVANLVVSHGGGVSGLITAKVSADQRVALILNTPFKGGFARQDDVRPQISFEVQPKHLEHPGYWMVSLKYFGAVRPDTNIQYSLEIDYPYSKDRSGLWLIATVIAFALGLLAAVRLGVIFWRGMRKKAG